MRRSSDSISSAPSRIADTEINKAYNDTRLNAVELAAERTGLRAGVLHISALLPTTRDNHAARHGLVYTPQEQMQWWNTGSNRINCKCSTESVLVDNEGRVVDTERQESTREAGRSFFN